MLQLIERLAEEGAPIQAYHPHRDGTRASRIANIAYCESSYSAALGHRSHHHCTVWGEFRSLDWERVKKLVGRPLSAWREL